MPSYHISYFNTEKKTLKEASIFMKSLAFAKRSALIHAPEQTCCIEIKALMAVTLTAYSV